jgi:hypothetical protein
MTVTYTDDPDFSGYDSDREETMTKYCQKHQQELLHLTDEEHRLQAEKDELVQKWKDWEIRTGLYPRRI